MIFIALNILKLPYYGKNQQLKKTLMQDFFSFQQNTSLTESS